MLKPIGFMVFGALVVCAAGAFMNGTHVDEEKPVAGDLKAELMEADRAFARETKAKRLEGWMSFMAEDAVRLSPMGQKALVGKAAVRELDKKMFADPGQLLQWEPVDGGAFADGKHGFTTGKGRMVRKKDDGTEETIWSGVYTTVWRKNEMGQWKVILDTGANE